LIKISLFLPVFVVVFGFVVQWKWLNIVMRGRWVVFVGVSLVGLVLVG
jgi:hypothetical protein